MLKFLDFIKYQNQILLSVIRRFSLRGYGYDLYDYYRPPYVSKEKIKLLSKTLQLEEELKEKKRKEEEEELDTNENNEIDGPEKIKHKNHSKKPLERNKFLKIRWGIAPVSLIADDFAKALSWLHKEHHQLVACAASYKSQADAFAQKHFIPKVFTNFEDLAKCKEVDVVYISPLTPMHMELSELMLNNGKHVLCEKPLCMNERESLRLIDQSRAKSLFLMEAVWSRFLPAYQHIRKRIDEGRLGQITKVECSYGFDTTNVERLRKRELGGGVTLDFGVYPIQFLQWVFRMAPLNVTADAKLNSSGVDTDVNIRLDYFDRKGEFKLSSTKDLDNLAVITGTTGEMVVPDYWCPTKIYDYDGALKEFHFPKSDYKYNYPNRVGMLYEAEEVRQCLMDHRTESPRMSHNESLLLAKTIDEIRSLIGVSYHEDLGYANTSNKSKPLRHQTWLRIKKQ